MNGSLQHLPGAVVDLVQIFASTETGECSVKIFRVHISHEVDYVAASITLLASENNYQLSGSRVNSMMVILRDRRLADVLAFASQCKEPHMWFSGRREVNHGGYQRSVR